MYIYTHLYLFIYENTCVYMCRYMTLQRGGKNPSSAFTVKRTKSHAAGKKSSNK